MENPALTDILKSNSTIKAVHSLRRFGNPDGVADVVLLIPTNEYITGQTISINGVWHMTS